MSRLHAVSTVVAMAGLISFGEALSQPDPANSYYTPEAVTNLGVTVTGVGDATNSNSSALFYFKTCPNNHGGVPSRIFGWLTNNARIRVAVRDGLNDPIVGMVAADICVVFNGGTPAQGYGGMGSDEIVANSALPTTNGAGGWPLCPDVRCIQADGATDAAGETVITFTGAGGVRDPNRKWGHAETEEIPIFAGGVQIVGRLSPVSAHGSYQLQIVNVDHVGGLTAVAVDVAEAVTSADMNVWLFNGFDSSRDFNRDGFKGPEDFNILVFHTGHDCDTPSDP